MQVAPAIVNWGGGVEVLPMNFGYFHRSGASMINNARSETTYGSLHSRKWLFPIVV